MRAYGVSTILAVLAAVLFVSCGTVDHSAQIAQHKKLAGELHSNRLYHAAVDEYRRVLDFDELDGKQRANICYLVARTYFEDIKDYRNAAAFYLRAREYDPEGSFMSEASRNLVASLEKLGNVIDAKRQLSNATALDREAASTDDVAVAKIGDRTIWLSEIEDQIAALPPEAQKQFVSRASRIEFVRQYVGVELLHAAAMREDYLADPDIQKQQEQMVKQLLVNQFVVDKVIPQVQVDSLDVHNFYVANKDSRYNGVPYDSVRAKVFLDYQNEKAESAYSEYIARLAKAERVEFLDHNVK